MKFALMFANTGAFAEPDALARLAQTAENVGIESMWAVEHVVVPVAYDSPYPYNKSGKLPGHVGSAIPDPVVSLAFVASVTKKIRLGTGILILPQRHPLYVAKEFATLDVLSKGRAILGIGSGWLAEEFAAVGIPFRERGARTDEAIRAIRSLWSDGTSTFDGKYYRWPAVESNPKPVQPKGVPIVVGGHSEAAARRAARLGDGFFPAKGDLATLRGLFELIRTECRRIGRDPAEIELTSGAPQTDVDVVRQFEDLGVSRMTLGPGALDEDSVRRNLEDFGDRVIAKL